jgi:hypothetical protein
MNAVKAKSMEEPAGNHLSTIDWQRGEWTAAPGKYSRQHLWYSPAKLKASDSGALLPAAYRDKVAINPHNMVAVVGAAEFAHALATLLVQLEPFGPFGRSPIDPASRLGRRRGRGGCRHFRHRAGPCR